MVALWSSSVGGMLLSSSVLPLPSRLACSAVPTRGCLHGTRVPLGRLVSSEEERRWGVLGVCGRSKGVRSRREQVRCAADAGAAGVPSGSGEEEEKAGGEFGEASGTPQQKEDRGRSLTSMWRNWQTNAGEMRAQVAKLGLAAVLAYGLFDGVTYTSFFVLAFLGYEKSTGQNPAANLKALLGVVILMWTGNNVTRPLRVAGAAALAPLIDKFLMKTQEVLKLPNQAFAFMIVVASFASLCFSIVGVLILSRWGR